MTIVIIFFIVLRFLLFVICFIDLIFFHLDKKTAWNQFLARTPGVPRPTTLTSIPRRTQYGICNLSLSCCPAKTGTEWNFGVQGQQQVLSDYFISLFLASFLCLIVLVQLLSTFISHTNPNGSLYKSSPVVLIVYIRFPNLQTIHQQRHK